MRNTQPLRRTALVVLLLLAGLLAPTAPARASTDDYPWARGSRTASDTFGFTQRQCVSYAAWRLYKSGHKITNRTSYAGRTYYWGSAFNWDSTAVALHKVVSQTPKVGAVAQWNAHEKSAYYSGNRVGTFQAGEYGHVAWVTVVYRDRTVLVRQYNLNSAGTYSQMRVKAPRYLYLS